MKVRRIWNFDIDLRHFPFRCLQETCRGIHFETGTCKLLFDTNDVSQNEKTKYSQVVLSGDSELLINGNNKCRTHEANIVVIITLSFYARPTNIRFFSVFHKCSSVSPCHNGGVCEAVEGIYQCNCTGTAHHGTVCQKGRKFIWLRLFVNLMCAIYYSFFSRSWFYLTAGNPWTAPDDWNTLHPQLNLNLDDQTPYSMYNGESYVSTEVINYSKFDILLCW